MEDTHESEICICSVYSEGETEDGDRATSQSDLYYDLKKNSFYTIYRKNYYYGNDPISENTYSVSEKEAYDFFKMYATENDKETLDDKVKEIFDKFKEKRNQDAEKSIQTENSLAAEKVKDASGQMQQDSSEIVQAVVGFKSFEEVKAQYPNAVDLSSSAKKAMSYKDVTEYLKSIVDDVMVTADDNKIAISDNYEHIEKSSDFTSLNRRGKKEIKTYAAEIKKIVPNSFYEKEIVNKDPNKVDVEKFKYYGVPIWINNRAYNVLLECACLKENRVSDSATRKGASNEHVHENSNGQYIRIRGKLQVLGISYLYNIKNRPLPYQNQTNDSNQPVTINVNGTDRVCKNGVVEGFKNAVKQNDELINDYNSLVKDYNSLAEENKKLREQLQSQNNNNTRKSSGNSYS